MKTHKLCGLGTALVTPFNAKGDVDYESLAVLVERQIKGGADYLVVLGTTGEAVTMTADERVSVYFHSQAERRTTAIGVRCRR